MAEAISAHRGPTAPVLAAAVADPTTRQMLDSAYPLVKPRETDIILIYVGGDTVHPWTNAEIAAMPARYRFPCWVRSDPQNVSAGQDAALFAAWLHGHQVPQETCVILDLETAVATAYVEVFNLAMRAAGYKTTKYGSESSIWQNPETDGGTYVAEPGPDVLTTEGDTVARQYAYDGAYDLSIVKSQAELPLWEPHPPAPAPVDPPDWADKLSGDLGAALAAVGTIRSQMASLTTTADTKLAILAAQLKAAQDLLAANVK